MGDEGRVEPASEAAASPRRRRRWPWLVLALLVVFVAGLRVALPTIVERGAAYGSRYWLGLPARVDNADFELLDGVVVLEGVSVGADPDGVEPTDAALSPPVLDAASALLHFDRVALRLSWQDLREGRVRVTDLALDAPSIRVIREEDGAIDPLRHAKPLAPPAEEEAAEEAVEGEPWPVLVDRFALTAPNVVILDPPSGQSLLEFSLEKFELEAIAVRGTDFALGGVGIEGPVLRVRRDLVLASPKAARVPKAAADAGAPVAAREGDATSAPAAQTGNATSAAAPRPPAADSAPPAADSTSPGAESAPAADSASPGASSTATAQPPPAAPKQPGYRIDRIDIARATFTWVTDRGPLDVTLALKASDISADEGHRFPFDLSLEIEKGRIALAGDVGILPPSYTGKVSWSGLPFPPLLLASLPDLAAWLRSANSTGDLQLDADVAGVRGAPTLRMSGRTSVDALEIGDPGQKEFALGWTRLDVAMKELVVPLPEAGKPARTTVASFEHVKLEEPKIRYTHPSPALNALLGIAPAPPADAASKAAPPAASAGEKPRMEKLPTDTASSKTPAAAAPPAAADAPAATPQASPPVDVSIASLELVAGDAEVLDTTVTPPVTSTVKELHVSARDVHFPDPSANAIRLRALLPTSSSLTVEGDLRAGNNGDFRVALQKLDLPTFSPYATAAGATLDAGQASVVTKVQLRGARMKIDNQLVLAKLGVSLRDPSSFERSFGVPIDLALALLRDPKGDIRLNIPVAIDEKGTQVSTGAIIASALRAALVGALTSPLKMLGAAFGGSGEGAGGVAIAPVPAEPGGAALASDAASRADALARLLSERPSMALTLRGRTSPEDRPVVAEQMLVERLKNGDGLPDLEGAGFLARRRVSAAFLARDPSVPTGKRKKAEPLSSEDQTLFDRYVAAVEIPPARLDALAAARAGAVRELLLARKIDPVRVEVGPREAEGPAGVVVGLRAL